MPHVDGCIFDIVCQAGVDHAFRIWDVTGECGFHSGSDGNKRVLKVSSSKVEELLMCKRWSEWMKDSLHHTIVNFVLVWLQGGSIVLDVEIFGI